MTTKVKPKALHLGDTIGIAASASPFDAEEFEKGLKTLREMGFKVKFREDIFSKKSYLAGTDQRRAQELRELFLDSEVKAILFARGGYGTLRILPLLKSSVLQENPKIVLGYSDMTSFLNFLIQKFSWTVFHGPVVAKGLGDTFKEEGKNSLLKALTSPQALGEFSQGISYLKNGTAQGTLVGGCLSILNSTLQTPFEIETENKILFLEEVNEPLYKIDRLLTQLKLAGKLRGLKGLLLGAFRNCGEKTDLQNLILETFADQDLPIVWGFPSGHVENMLCLPLGIEVGLNSAKNTVNFLEGALRT